MRKYKGLKIGAGIFVILLAIVHIWLSYGTMVIFGIMEGFVVNATNAEKVWLGSGLWMGIFLLISGILIFYEKKHCVLAVCVADIIYWLVPWIADVVRLDHLQNLAGFYDDTMWILFAFGMADVVEIVFIIFLWRMKNKKGQSLVLSENQPEGK